MVDNSNMPHPKCLGSHKNPGTEPITCEKGPKLGFEYLPTSKTSHCMRTACMAFPESHSLGFFSGRLGFKQWAEQMLSDQATVNGNAPECRRVRRRFESRSADRSSLPNLILVQTPLSTNF